MTSHRACTTCARKAGPREIDLIAELGLQHVIGLEIKARSAPSVESAKHLVWLRDQLGDAFVGGVVLHTGRHVYRLSERIVAAPICTIWA